LIVRVFANKRGLGTAAAEYAAAEMRAAIAERGIARVVAATGMSQLEFLEALSERREVDWQRVELFQLDEYIGVPMTHPASFSRYLRERFVSKAGIAQWHALNGAEDPEATIGRASAAIAGIVVDVAFVGIGENGHLAFNDPPADFVAHEPYIRVQLDEACRRQQVGEGWFADLAAVPKEAISMSVHEIRRASPLAPASILQRHGDTTIFLDRESASLLDAETLRRFAAVENSARRDLQAARKLEVPE